MKSNKKIISKLMVMMLTGGVLAGGTSEFKIFASGLGDKEETLEDSKKIKDPKLDREDKKEKRGRGDKNVLIKERISNLEKRIEEIGGILIGIDEGEISEGLKKLAESISDDVKKINGNIRQINISIKDERIELVKENEDIKKCNREVRLRVHLNKIHKIVDGRKINKEIEKLNGIIEVINWVLNGYDPDDKFKEANNGNKIEFFGKYLENLSERDKIEDYEYDEEYMNNNKINNNQGNGMYDEEESEYEFDEDDLIY